MAHAERVGLFSGSSRLVAEYSIAPGGSGGGGSGAGTGGRGGGSSSAVGGGGGSSSGSTLDWICPRCTSVNFARRLECYQCAAVRPADPLRVASDKDGPSNVLKVSGLEEDASEDMLTRLFSAHAPVAEVRMVRDKFSGAPRNFAFVQYAEVQDATRAMNGLQGVRAGGSTLRICYARDRAVGPAAASDAALAKGQDALQAAQAMQQYSGWEPKAFGQDADEEAAPAAPAPSAEPEPTSAAAAAISGFVYDTASGYYYDAKSGYYYDANSTLYYHPSTSQWYSYDKATGAYAVAGGGSVAEAAAAGGTGEAGQAGSSSAAQSAIAATEAALSEAAAKRAATAAAAGGVSAVERKRSACIGAAPQLSSQGLMAAVQQMEERELQNRALAAQKQRDEQKRLQQQGVAQQGSASVAPVTGVIHKGKWASRGAADQKQ